MKRVIYADNAATTQLDETAFEAMKPWLLYEFGNPSQPYALARKPKKAIAEARATIAECIHAEPEEIPWSLSTRTDAAVVSSLVVGAGHTLVLPGGVGPCLQRK